MSKKTKFFLSLLDEVARLTAQRNQALVKFEQFFQHRYGHSFVGTYRGRLLETISSGKAQNFNNVTELDATVFLDMGWVPVERDEDGNIILSEAQLAEMAAQDNEPKPENAEGETNANEGV